MLLVLPSIILEVHTYIMVTYTTKLAVGVTYAGYSRHTLDVFALLSRHYNMLGTSPSYLR